MIQALIQALQDVPQDCGLIHLSADGPVFCAGACLYEMAHYAQKPLSENLAHSQYLGNLLYAVAHHKALVIAEVTGSVWGGGVGLLCAADLVYTTATVQMGLPELQLGLIPAIISPYLTRAIGQRRAAAWLYQGHTIQAQQAMDWGLVHGVCENPSALNERVQHQLAYLSQAGTEALHASKVLFQSHKSYPDAETRANLAFQLATVRATPHAQAKLMHKVQKKLRP
jgi:methylglutaconyl-CoA hydratase